MSGIIDPRPTVASPDDDPWTWLENVEDDRALVWVAAQNSKSSSLIGVTWVKRLVFSHPFDWSIFSSIASVAARRLDVSEGREVDIDDGFERVGCCAVSQAVWECCEPVGVLSLQCEQSADGVTPTLGAAPSIGRAA